MTTHLQPYTPDTAPLPINYEAAKLALAACANMDECKDWSDRAAAIASYARQKRDRSLFDKAERIKARAIRRLGELVQEQKKRTGETMRSIAERAGISKREASNGVAVARVKSRTFERNVEHRSPPLPISKLIKLGQDHPFGTDTSAPCWLLTERLLKLTREFPTEAVAASVASCTAQQRDALKHTWSFIDEWQDAIQSAIDHGK